MTAVLPGRVLTDTVHEQVEYETGVAYADGYRQALHDVCTRIVEVENLNRHLWDAARADARNYTIRRRAATELAYRQQLEREGRTEYGGGPVEWDSGQPVPRGAWRDHDRDALAAGLRYQPAADWRDIHASVDPGVWGRIWADLSDHTRRRVADLDPAQPQRAGHTTRGGRAT